MLSVYLYATENELKRNGNRIPYRKVLVVGKMTPVSRRRDFNLVAVQQFHRRSIEEGPSKGSTRPPRLEAVLGSGERSFLLLLP